MIHYAICLVTFLGMHATAFVSPFQTHSTITTKLYHNAPPPKHDVGENPMANFTPEQMERAKSYMEHQQNAAKVGFAVDVRSLIQYNHGFAVMSTNSKS